MEENIDICPIISSIFQKKLLMSLHAYSRTGNIARLGRKKEGEGEGERERGGRQRGGRALLLQLEKVMPTTASSQRA